MNPVTKALDWLGSRNRRLNTPIVGADAATNGARCVSALLLMAIVANIWVVLLVIAVATHATDLQADSYAFLIVLGVPLAWLGLRYSAISARLAADHVEKEVGFRPRWWACYSSPRGWNAAIERQKRWNARGRWPLIPW